MVAFGTDGIRGKFGKDLTLDVAYRCGNALSGNVVVGADTRESGKILAKKLIDGIVDAG